MNVPTDFRRICRDVKADGAAVGCIINRFENPVLVKVVRKDSFGEMGFFVFANINPAAFDSSDILEIPPTGHRPKRKTTDSHSRSDAFGKRHKDTKDLRRKRLSSRRNFFLHNRLSKDNPQKNFVKPSCLGVLVASFFPFLIWGMSHDIMLLNAHLFAIFFKRCNTFFLLTTE